jgi:hypothetical protein
MRSNLNPWDGKIFTIFSKIYHFFRHLYVTQPFSPLKSGWSDNVLRETVEEIMQKWQYSNVHPQIKSVSGGGKPELTGLEVRRFRPDGLGKDPG